jgi:hypothetical protein
MPKTDLDLANIMLELNQAQPTDEERLLAATQDRNPAGFMDSVKNFFLRPGEQNTQPVMQKPQPKKQKVNPPEKSMLDLKLYPAKEDKNYLGVEKIQESPEITAMSQNMDQIPKDNIEPFRIQNYDEILSKQQQEEEQKKEKYLARPYAALDAQQKDVGQLRALMNMKAQLNPTLDVSPIYDLLSSWSGKKYNYKRPEDSQETASSLMSHQNVIAKAQDELTKAESAVAAAALKDSGGGFDPYKMERLNIQKQNAADRLIQSIETYPTMKYFATGLNKVEEGIKTVESGRPITENLMSEIARAYASALTGANIATESGVKGITPNSLSMAFKQAISWVNGKPASLGSEAKVRELRNQMASLYEIMSNMRADEFSRLSKGRGITNDIALEQIKRKRDDYLYGAERYSTKYEQPKQTQSAAPKKQYRSDNPAFGWRKQ